MSKKTNTARILEDQSQTPEPTVAVVAEPLDDKGRKKEVRMSKQDLIDKGIKNKSQAIRFLNSENYSPSAIAKFMDIRYQHVRNVLNQVLKRVPATTEAPKVETKTAD